MSVRIPVLALALVSAVAAPAASGQDARGPRDLGALRDGRLDEVSGIVAGRENPDLLWVHNDSGDTARVFAVDMTGRTVAVVSLRGARAIDWEDIAIGPGPDEGRWYLYVGDIGDNARERRTVRVYRFPEPRLQSRTDPGDLSAGEVDVVTLRYPDGARNAETLLVDPATGDLVIVTKGSTHPEVYRTPAPPVGDSDQTLRRVGRLAFDPIPLMGDGGQGAVAGDVDRSGRFALLKSYLRIYRWTWNGAREMPFVGGPHSVPYDPEPQGEAVAIGPDGVSYYTLSEELGGMRPHLYVYGAR